jgi:hypothetical protein
MSLTVLLWARYAVLAVLAATVIALAWATVKGRE